MKGTGFVVAVMLWVAVANAHEGGVDARGVVAAASGDHVALRTADGVEQHFAVTARTRVLIGSAAGKIADLKPGMRAVVHGRKDGDRLEAVLVRAAPAGVPQRPSKDGK